MSTFLSIVLVLVAYIAIKFFWDLSKDSGDLAKIPVEKRFPITREIINQAAFQGKGTITKADRRTYSLYEDGKNQIVFFNV